MNCRAYSELLQGSLVQFPLRCRPYGPESEAPAGSLVARMSRESVSRNPAVDRRHGRLHALSRPIHEICGPVDFFLSARIQKEGGKWNDVLLRAERDSLAPI